MKKSGIPQIATKKPLPKPPKELGAAGRALWNKLQQEYALEDQGGLESLLTAARSEDDIQRMRARLAKDGDLIADRFGQLKASPLLQSIRGAETIKRQALRALNLDIEPPTKGGK